MIVKFANIRSAPGDPGRVTEFEFLEVVTVDVRARHVPED
jgi:hypothetical protein